MGAASTPTVERAKSIFTNLGYTVSGDGPEFLAEREWKVVRVTATPEEPPEADPNELHCFVTDREHGSQFDRRMQRADPDYEWAVIAVDENDEYDVIRAPPVGR